MHPPRPRITYEADRRGIRVERALPFVIGVLGDSAEGTHGLGDLVRGGSAVKIREISVPKEALRADLTQSGGLRRSRLFRTIYEGGYFGADAEPYGAIIGCHDWTSHPDDVETLRLAAATAAEACAAFAVPADGLPAESLTRRFIHHLKLLARDRIASFMEPDNAGAWLNRWVQDYAGEGCPLREAEAALVDVPGQPGRYNLVATLHPWLTEDRALPMPIVTDVPQP